jgi:hypothetical protein
MLMQDQMDRIVETSEDKGWSFLGNIVVMEEMPVAHANTRNKKQSKQWLKRAPRHH